MEKPGRTDGLDTLSAEQWETFQQIAKDKSECGSSQRCGDLGEFGRGAM